MYNRYVRNDRGTYTCIPQPDEPYEPRQTTPGQEPPPRQGPPPGQESQPGQGPPPGQGSQPGWESDFFSSGSSGIGGIGRGTIRRLLDRFHLDHIDKGDLLLLLLLFLLFKEDADEELLYALGLLLIL